MTSENGRKPRIRDPEAICCDCSCEHCINEICKLPDKEAQQ